MKSIAVVYFTAGSGHLTCAQAIATELRLMGYDAYELDVADLLAGAGVDIRPGIEAFNEAFRREAIPDFVGLCRAAVEEARSYPVPAWPADAPDMVISCCPIYNRVVSASARAANPRAECWVVPLDYREVVPGYWFGSAGYWDGSNTAICMTAALQKAAQDAGMVALRIGGCPVSAAFYGVPRAPWTTRSTRVLVTYGGRGSSELLAIHEQLKSIEGLTAYYACGDDIGTARAIQNDGGLAAAGAEVWPIPALMDWCDLVVCKPSTMLLNEAAVAGRWVVAVEPTTMAALHGSGVEWLHKDGCPSLYDLLPGEVARARDRKYTPRRRHHGLFDLCRLVSEAL